MPIAYTRAFGGKSPGPMGEVAWPHNPDGIGFYQTANEALGKALPNIEWANLPTIRSWQERPDPAGLGPYPMFWGLRAISSVLLDRDKNAAGISRKAFNQAHPALVLDAIAVGNHVDIEGMRQQRITFDVPRLPLALHWTCGTDGGVVALAIDGLYVWVDQQKVVVTHQGAISIPVPAWRDQICPIDQGGCMNQAAVAPRYGGLDALPMFIFVSAAMLALFILPNVEPERLIVDRWRFYLFTGVLTIAAWAVVGYLCVRLVGVKRPLMVLTTFTGMTMLPLVIGPVLGWLNARLDHSPATALTLKVCGYRLHSRNRGIVLRLQSEQPRFPIVEADETTNFIPRPVPADGTELRAEYHPGTFGIRWISTVGPTGPYKDDQSFGAAAGDDALEEIGHASGIAHGFAQGAVKLRAAVKKFLQARDAGGVGRGLRVLVAVEEQVEGCETKSVGLASAPPPMAACRSKTRGRPLARAAYSSPAMRPDQRPRREPASSVTGTPVIALPAGESRVATSSSRWRNQVSPSSFSEARHRPGGQEVSISPGGRLRYAPATSRL